MKKTNSYQGYYFWVPLVACHLGGVIGCWIYRLFIELHWPEADEDPQESKTRVFDVRSQHHHHKCPAAARIQHINRPVDGLAFRSACFDSGSQAKVFNLK